MAAENSESIAGKKKAGDSPLFGLGYKSRQIMRKIIGVKMNMRVCKIHL
jgi:hypothetical protein